MRQEVVKTVSVLFVVIKIGSEKMSDLKQKAKTLKVGVVPWQLWIKSPAYLKLTPEKKIKSLLTIIERLIAEIAKLKELLKNYNDQALAYEKSVEERLGHIQEWLKKQPKRFIICPASKTHPDQWRYPTQALDEWLKEGEKLVGLLEE